MGKGAKLTILMECLKHSNCKTGFCPDGVCRQPQQDDPCSKSEEALFDQGSCPSGFLCDIVLDRCKPKNYKSLPFGTCHSDGDCPVYQFCGNGKCEFWDFKCENGRCGDGSECYKNKCVPRCYDDSNCRYSDQCVQAPTTGFKMCIPKPKKGEPVEKPGNEPVAKPVEKPKEPSYEPTSKPGPENKTTTLFSDYQLSLLVSATVVICILIGGVIIAVVAIKKSKRRNSTNILSPPLAPPSPPMPQYGLAPGQQLMVHHIPYADAQSSEPPPTYPFTKQDKSDHLQSTEPSESK